MPDQILIIGSGSYVLGDAFGPAPVLRGALQWARRRSAQKPVTVNLTCRQSAKRQQIEAKASAIAKELDASAQLSVVSLEEADALLRKGLLAVFICVPDEAHEQYLREAIAAHCPAWIVKPLTGELKGAERVATLARAAGADIWVDYHKRFDPSNAYLRLAALDGRFGAPLHYAVQYSQPRSLPLDTFNWAAATDPFTYIGCHYVDQLDFLFPGIQIERVSALGITGAVHADLGRRAYDLVTAQLVGRLATGNELQATMQVGWCDPAGAPAKSHQRVEMTFAKGHVIADQTARGLQVWDDRSTQELNPYFFSAAIDPATQRVTYQGYGIDSIDRFLDWCVSLGETRETIRRSQSLPWIERALFTEKVLDMVRKSLDAQGAWISNEDGAHRPAEIQAAKSA